MTPRMKAIQRLQNIVDGRWERHWENELAPWADTDPVTTMALADEHFEKYAEECMGRHSYSWACRMDQVERKSIEYALNVLKAERRRFENAAEKVGDVLHDMPFSDVLQLAEALGWREPDLPGAWDATTADTFEEEAIDFILRAVVRHAEAAIAVEQRAEMTTEQEDSE